MADENDVVVRDDPAGNRYELLIDGVRAGDLHYLPTRGAVVLVHTEIAPDLEGQGLGGRLIAGALEAHPTATRGRRLLSRAAAERSGPGHGRAARPA